MTSRFSTLYALAYDLLNEGKPYKEETDFVQALRARYCGSAENLRSILDLGCGSGLHLSNFADDVRKTGVDLSDSMLQLARSRNIPKSEFIFSHVSDFHSSAKFDLIYSLFHVISYQVEVTDLTNTLLTIQRNLEVGGLAVFDFWHRAAWDVDPPVTRMTTKVGSALKVKRISSPKVDYVSGLVAIDMDIFVNQSGSKDDSTYIHFSEHHEMRAYTLQELNFASTLAGLKVVGSGPWMTTERELTSNDWYGWMALQKTAPA
jgi:SAM-dependent methyltransferase